MQVKEQAHQTLIDWSPNTCFFLTSTQVCTARGTQHCTADIAAPGVVCRWDRASRRGGRECQIALRTPTHHAVAASLNYAVHARDNGNRKVSQEGAAGDTGRQAEVVRGNNGRVRRDSGTVYVRRGATAQRS